LRVYQERLLFLDEFITLFSSLQVAPEKNGKALWKPIQTKSILDLQNLILNEKKTLIFINFEIFARLFRERFFSNKIQTSRADSNSIEIVVCFSIFRHAI
jgi:hypothetical protein